MVLPFWSCAGSLIYSPVETLGNHRLSSRHEHPAQPIQQPTRRNPLPNPTRFAAPQFLTYGFRRLVLHPTASILCESKRQTDRKVGTQSHGSALPADRQATEICNPGRLQCLCFTPGHVPLCERAAAVASPR